MAMLIIKSECISCYACEQECPTCAISQDAEGKFTIDPDLCVECEGFYEDPQCLSVCPIDGCIVKLEEYEPWVFWKT